LPVWNKTNVLETLVSDMSVFYSAFTWLIALSDLTALKIAATTYYYMNHLVSFLNSVLSHFNNIKINPQRTY
jgi:hypothetical protein